VWSPAHNGSETGRNERTKSRWRKREREQESAAHPLPRYFRIPRESRQLCGFYFIPHDSRLLQNTKGAHKFLSSFKRSACLFPYLSSPPRPRCRVRLIVSIFFALVSRRQGKSILILLCNFITPHLTRDKFADKYLIRIRMQICREDLSLSIAVSVINLLFALALFPQR